MVAPDSDDDNIEETVKDTNEKRSECWEENVIEKLIKIVEGTDDDEVFTDSEEESSKEDRRRLLEVEVKDKNDKVRQSMEPHPKDKELWVKIKRLAEKNNRRLAVASYMATEGETLHDLLEKTHDRHRILSLLRWHDNRKQSKRSKKLRKSLENSKNPRRRPSNVISQNPPWPAQPPKTSALRSTCSRSKTPKISTTRSDFCQNSSSRPLARPTTTPS